MKRTGIKRGLPLQAYTPLQRQVPLRRTKPEGERVVAVAGESDRQRYARKPARYTGPPRKVCLRVDKRSGRMCEWPGCTQPQAERHHRLNRKNGGRHGDARVRVNGAAWLLAACRVHHAYVTSPHGDRRRVAEQMGWLLREHQEATQVPVRTRHDPEPVWLDNSGDWHRYEEGAA